MENPNAGLPRRVSSTVRLGLRGWIERRIPFASPESIRRLQTHRLRRIIDHAYRYVPFYRNAMRELGLRPKEIRTVEDLARLPLVDGADLQRDLAAYVSTAFPRSSLVELYSTGTAAYGAKTVFWTPNELMAQVAHGERDRSVLRRLLGVSRPLVRLSFFHPDSSTSMVSRFHASRLIIPRGKMTTQWASCELPFDEVAKLLGEVRPDVVYSYGSFAESFLLRVCDRRWNVRLPKVWVFGGDSVSHEGRRTIEQHLDCLLYSTYQAIEAGRIGFECEERSGYHINVDLCHVRLVNGRGEAVDSGESGEVVISNLYHRGTVLLNYRLGDEAAWSEDPCPCGRSLPVLRLSGARTSSTLRLRDGGQVQEHVILHACKASMHDILQFQIVETSPESIVWKVVPSQQADRDRIASALTVRSRSVLSPDAEIGVEFVDRITGHGGKLTHIVRSPMSSDDASTQSVRSSGDP